MAPEYVELEEFEELKEDLGTLKSKFNNLLEFLDNANLKQKIDFYELEVDATVPEVVEPEEEPEEVEEEKETLNL